MEAWHKKQSGVGDEWIGSQCLWWATFTVNTLNGAGIPAQIQAGSAYWPRLRPDQDDGVSNTHFGYEYTPGPKNLHKIVAGHLPEIHCWAAIVKENVIIDVTTQYWPDNAKRLCGYDWPGVLPPSFVWCRADQLPDGVRYRPNLEAIKNARHAFCLAMAKFTIVTDD